MERKDDEDNDNKYYLVDEYNMAVSVEVEIKNFSLVNLEVERFAFTQTIQEVVKEG